MAPRRRDAVYDEGMPNPNGRINVMSREASEIVVVFRDGKIKTYDYDAFEGAVYDKIKGWDISQEKVIDIDWKSYLQASNFCAEQMGLGFVLVQIKDTYYCIRKSLAERRKLLIHFEAKYHV
jgi:hypothetical protein